jgi:phosphoglycerate dehydrogenase-like enzyme
MKGQNIVYFSPAPHEEFAAYLDGFAEPSSIIVGGIRGSVDEDAVCEIVKDASLILIMPMSPMISKKVLEAATQLELVQSIVVGFDNVDVKAATELGIPVANNPGWNSTSVAEHTIMLILMTLRQTPHALKKNEDAKGWKMPEEFMAFYQKMGELEGKKLGIIGLGDIGKKVAKLAVAFGANVVYNKRNRLSIQDEKAMGVEYRSFSDLLSESDIVSLHVPLNDETRFMIGEEELALMKEGSIIINTARAAILDEQAVADALKSGKLSAAGIDDYGYKVVDGYMVGNSPLVGCENALLTPHLAGTSRDAMERWEVQWVDNARRFLTGEKPLYILNGVWPRKRL